MICRQWNRYPREVVEPRPLEVYKNHVGVALGNILQCWTQGYNGNSWTWWSWRSLLILTIQMLSWFCYGAAPFVQPPKPCSYTESQTIDPLIHIRNSQWMFTLDKTNQKLQTEQDLLWTMVSTVLFLVLPMKCLLSKEKRIKGTQICVTLSLWGIFNNFISLK